MPWANRLPPGGPAHGSLSSRRWKVEIRSFSNSASRPAVRVAAIDPEKATVNQQSFYDREGKLLAYLNPSSISNYPEHQVSLPQRVEIYIAGRMGRRTS